jgi:hypothetical protein
VYPLPPAVTVWYISQGVQTGPAAAGSQLARPQRTTSIPPSIRKTKKKRKKKRPSEEEKKKKHNKKHKTKRAKH